MIDDTYIEIFTRDVLKKLFPKNRSDNFFDALYGDPAEGAYDICLEFKGQPRHGLAIS